MVEAADRPKVLSPEWERTGEKILITGYSGLVGASILDAALGKDRLVGLSRGKTTDQFSGDERLQVVNADLLDRKSLEEAFRTAEASVVIHLAAATDVDKCQADPDFAHQMNVEATENLVVLAREYDVPVVNFSTDLVLPGLGGPFHEDQERGLIYDQEGKEVQIYGSTKANQERVVEHFLRGKGINFRIIGPYDPRSANKGGGTPVAIARRLLDGKPINAVDMVGGRFVATPAANNYVYGGDIAAVLNRVIREKLWEKQNVIHVGGPEMLTAWDIAQIVLKHYPSTSQVGKTTQEEYFKDKAPRPVHGGLVCDTLDKWGYKTERFEDVFIREILPKAA